MISISRSLSSLLWLWAFTALWITTSPNPVAAAKVATSGHEPLLGFSQDVVLEQDQRVPAVAVFYGNARLEGVVDDAVFVLHGDLELAGEVRGGVVVLFGNVHAKDGARVRGQTLVLAGSLTEDPGASLRGRKHIYSLDSFPIVKGGVDWVSNGLFYLRPLPHNVAWVWWVPAAFFGLYLFLSLMMPRPIQASAEAIAGHPVISYGAGLLACVVLLFSMPLFLVLAPLGIGLLLIAATLMIAAFSRAAMTQFLGAQLGRALRSTTLERPVLALLLGSLLLCALYTLPVLGLLVWVGSFPLALGGVVVAAGSALKSWRQSTSPPAEPASSESFTPGGSAAPAIIDPNSPPPLPNPTISTGIQSRPVGFFIRTVATTLDLILIAVVGGVFGVSPQLWMLLWTLYHVLLWSWMGSTIGGRVLGCELLEADGSRIGFRTSVIRALAAFLSAIPLFLGFFWAAWDWKKQSWHDKLTGVQMVRRNSAQRARQSTP